MRLHIFNGWNVKDKGPKPAVSRQWCIIIVSRSTDIIEN